MLHVVLFRPEIPQNTGNIGRTCAVACCRLHLIHPLGFRIEDKHLKRSGMDYWHSLDLRHHESWEAFRSSPDGPQRLFLFTTHASRLYWDADYRSGDGLLFGNEGSGVPDWLRKEIASEEQLKIPHGNGALRSLNLSTSAGVAVFEALRQMRAGQ